MDSQLWLNRQLFVIAVLLPNCIYFLCSGPLRTNWKISKNKTTLSDPDAWAYLLSLYYYIWNTVSCLSAMLEYFSAHENVKRNCSSPFCKMAKAACNFFLMKNGFFHGVHLKLRLKTNYILTPNDYYLVNVINHFVYSGQFQCLFCSLHWLCRVIGTVFLFIMKEYHSDQSVHVLLTLYHFNEISS